ncbi:ATG16-domain-containing protein [Tilletiaria anomala UBC 951]|uniref:ATG16-domain-containing protein n=1 Tax=Tilletiaria anomala (strain ATCC 24038 / CBS 436.72 / UBC 951) TaxID=1037660 RepID=A0A066W418_TILAU|nr:ATG16-domain-containing protein [Tilletiaria anomala UBC 951]KDN48461.1 ATG16-domain-containing protein [Tilletiaria anomala UBC 951]
MSGSTATASVTYASAYSTSGASSPFNNGGAITLNTWQDAICKRWEERDRHERAFDDMIQQYQKLARHAAMLKERNTSLLQAASAPTPAAVASSASAAGTASAPAATTGVGPNAVQEAYVRSLEAQLSSMRDELAELYKTQSQNAQRLLVLNETLRERQDVGKASDDELRALRGEQERLQRAAQDAREALGEKDRTIQILQDELNTLSLELSQIELRNDELKRDNASLLQRWLDRMNAEADKMNDANTYLEQVKATRTKDSSTDSSTSQSKPATLSASAAS